MTRSKVTIDKARDDELPDIIACSPYAQDPSALGSLQDFVSRSTSTWVGRVDGQIACMWGLIPPTLLSDSAYLWLITTNLVDDHKFVFIRYSQRVMEFMLEDYPKIRGTVFVDNPRARRWLKWLGADMGQKDGPTIPFIIKAKNG